MQLLLVVVHQDKNRLQSVPSWESGAEGIDLLLTRKAHIINVFLQKKRPCRA